MMNFKCKCGNDNFYVEEEIYEKRQYSKPTKIKKKEVYIDANFIQNLEIKLRFICTKCRGIYETYIFKSKDTIKDNVGYYEKINNSIVYKGKKRGRKKKEVGI